MALCSVCQSIDFSNLPSLPAHYESHHFAWTNDAGMVGFLSPRLGEARKAGQAVNEREFSQPLGVAHYQSITELTAAAQNCPICRLIEREISGDLAARAEAEKDEVFTYYQKRRNSEGPEYRLWLAKRQDECEGFLIVSADKSLRGEVWLLAAVGFCVEDNDPLSALIPGRVVQSDSSTDTTLARAVGFVRECDEHHTDGKCSVGEEVLPTRVLDLGPDASSNVVKLIEPDGVKGKYTALSHRWGSSNPHATTRASLEAYSKSVPVDDLPKTFQDAITLTRRLGLRYLWVDALCICQDDGPEWERESSKMATIYSQAYLVIAATGAAQDSQGLFFPRTPPTHEIFSHTRSDVTGDLHAFAIPKDNRAAASFGYSELNKEPLSTRGWVLQERLLASRTLHFASDQLFFECYTHFRSENGYKMSGRLNSIHADSKPKTAKRSHYNKPDSVYRGPSSWYGFLTDYTRKKLTKSSDKLPALSGLARIVEKQTGDTYVAGLWRSTLLEGILWQAIGTHRGATGAPAEYRAPSWSWASIDGLAGNLGVGKDIISANGDREWMDIGIVLDCHVELKGENPYGEVTSGWIKLKAPIEPLIPSEEKEPDHETLPHKRALRMRTKTGKAFGSYCMFDTLSDEGALELSLFVMPLVYIEREKSGEGKSESESERTFQALIITPVEAREGTYRRVGKMILGDGALGECEWRDEAKMETVVLL